MLPKKSTFVHIVVSSEEELQTLVDSYAQAVRAMLCSTKTGTLPQYLWSNKTSEVAETTETYSVDMVRSSHIKRKELQRDWATRSAGSGEHRERAKRRWTRFFYYCESICLASGIHNQIQEPTSNIKGSFYKGFHFWCHMVSKPVSYILCEL